MSLADTLLTAWRGRRTHVTTQEFAAFIGLGWADAKHAGCLHVAGSDKREGTTLAHRPAGIAAWVTDLRHRFEGQPSAIARALNKGPIVEALRKYDGLVLLHSQPMMLARYRQAFTPSRAQDDPTAAALQLDLLLRPRDTLTPFVPPNLEMRALAPLVEHRRRLVEERVRLTNRRTSTVQTYVPHVLQWCPHTDTMRFCDVLSQWPTLTAAQRARRRTLERVFHQPHVRDAPRIQECLTAIKSAGPLTTDEGS